MTEEYSLAEVVRILQRIERRLDDVSADHEARLRHVERWVWAVPPTLLLVVASVVSSILGH